MPRRAEITSIQDRIVERLIAAGYPRVEPDLLVPADLVRDLVGEALARRLFITTDNDGAELCLRPDYTIPLVRSFLENGRAAGPARFCYAGSVFRQRPGQSGEFTQAGVELLGADDPEAAEAEVVALAIEAARAATRAELSIVMGDVGVFLGLLQALGLSPAWRRRLAKEFRRAALRDVDFDRLMTTPAVGPNHAGLLTALDGADPKAARALVADLLSIAGIATVGGRPTADIAERFLEQASLSAEGLPAEKVAVLRDILSIEATPLEAAELIRAVARAARIDLSEPLAALDRRNMLIAGKGVDLSTVRFSSRFGREMDYYTGLVFEIYDTAGRAPKPLVGGGRYDRLTEMMLARHGKAGTVPAVGCAFLVERFLALGPTL